MQSVQRILSLGLLVVICFSCDDTPKDSSLEQDQFEGQDKLVIQLKKDVKSALTLTPEASEATDTWTTYKTLQHNLSIKRDTLSIGKMKAIVAAMISSFESQGEAENAKVSVTPQVLNTPAINARILTVETQLRVLNNLLSKQNLDTTQIKMAWGGLHNAFQNANLQINERFALSVEEILEQLKEEDSIAGSKTISDSNISQD